MYRALASIVAFTLPGIVLSQNLVEQIKLLKNRSIDINTEFFTSINEIENLDEIFAGKQVVALGEQNHQDGTTFEIYTDMVKLLHDRYGFEAIVFESGFYDCYKAWEDIERGESPRLAIGRSIFNIWAGSEQMQPLFEYIIENANQSNQLKLAGFDCQFSGYYGRKTFLTDIDSVISMLDAGFSSSQEYNEWKTIAEQVTDYSYPPTFPSPESESLFFNITDKIQNLFRNSVFDNNGLWIHAIENLEVQAKNIWSLKELLDGKITGREYTNLRDAQMAKNVFWLLNGPLKDKKIILWGNFSHLARNLNSMELKGREDLFKRATTMGDYLYSRLGDKFYTIGTISYEGATGSGEIPPAPEGSLEYLFQLTQKDAAFLDFTQFKSREIWINEPLIARPDSKLEIKANWPNVFDGVLFINTMKPSIQIKE